MKRSIFILSILVFLGFCGIFTFDFLSAKLLLQRNRLKPPTIPAKILHEKIEVKSDEGFSLNAYWVKAKQNSNTVVICLHGIGGHHGDFIGNAREMAAIGIETILLDLRGHGNSEGQYCTFGFHEKQDVENIIDHILSKKPTAKIGIWGRSLGGAIAFNCLAHDQRIQFGITESTYASFDTIVRDYAKRFTGIGSSWILNRTINKAESIANFDAGAVHPIDKVKTIEQNMLLLHGDKDSRIKKEYAEVLFENLKSINKELVIIENGYHIGLQRQGGQKYEEAVFGFLKKQKQKP